MGSAMTVQIESRASQGRTGAGGPFDFTDGDAYLGWREEKLRRHPAGPEALMVPIGDPRAPTGEERDAIAGRCRMANMALYSTHPGLNKGDVAAFAGHFGLRRLDSPLCTGEDGVTEIQTADSGRRAAYIPYTDRHLNWHTDGCYNEAGKQVQAFLLHCERSAESGGETAILDPEIAYIRLRDEDPDLIRALMRPDALHIPANLEGGKIVRPARTGSVFSVIGGRLHMRYTQRNRHVEWNDDAKITEARAFLADMLESGEPLVIHHRLKAGQGLICNNVLHSRTAFQDRPEPERRRLVYRARFLDPVQPADGH